MGHPEISGLLREGRHWTGKVLTRFPEPSPSRPRLLLTRGVLAIFKGELSDAAADLEDARELSGARGDAPACALAHTYRCLAFVFSGRHAEAAEAELRAAALG